MSTLSAQQLQAYSFKPVAFHPRQLRVQQGNDGEVFLHNERGLTGVAKNLAEVVAHNAAKFGQRTFLAQRDVNQNWVHLSYAQLWLRAGAIATWLKKQGYGQDNTVMILSGNSIEHAVMMYGSIIAGVPVSSISTGYSLIAKDFTKLKFTVDLLSPDVIFCQNATLFEQPLRAVASADIDLVYVEDDITSRFNRHLSYAQILTDRDDTILAQCIAELKHDSVAKYLFTSGSTGMPKAVINTHGMMCLNPLMRRAMINEGPDEPAQVQLDWLPWNHTFGGNSNLNGTLILAGTLYIDDGRPVPGQFAQTVENLKEIKPNYYSNVPAAYAMLANEMEQDSELRDMFFTMLPSLPYGGAKLAEDLCLRLQNLSVQAIGQRFLLVSSYGSTETAPVATNTHWQTDVNGLIGLPVPGVSLRLVPDGERFELRIKAATVTPGYYQRPELNEQAFDELGYYRIGDAVRFVDADDPAQGLLFDGRVSEDFKLNSGTWVAAGALRVKGLEACTPVLQDALVTGLGHDYVALLAWLDFDACRRLFACDDSDQQLLGNTQLREYLMLALTKYNQSNPGSSTRIKRIMLLSEPPNLEAGEITEKRYLNQSLSLRRRDDDVQRLYAKKPGEAVMVVQG